MTETPTLHWAINLLIAQGLMGGFDTLYHHELTVALPRQYGARLELAIHAVRAILYGVLFVSIAHLAFQGRWVLGAIVLVLVEVLLTLWDFVVEDRSRKLPATERVLHTVLAINGGALFALYGWQLAQWYTLPTGLVFVSYGWRTWALTLFGVGVTASGIRDAIAAVHLHRQQTRANPFEEIPYQRVLITGGTGFIGTALVNQLVLAGHTATVLTRDRLRAAYLFAGQVRCIRSIEDLASDEVFDIVINLAGAPVVGPLWSRKRKAELLASRIDTTIALVKWARRTRTKPNAWIQASAIGFYGVRDPSEVLAEDSRRGNGFMADLCVEWEQAAQPATSFGIRQVTLRLGLVFGPGGALPALLLPVRLGVGGRIGDGRQFLSWIHRDDVLALIARATVDLSIAGIYNAVAPEPMCQWDFIRTAGAVLKRPIWLHLPAGPIRQLVGEMAQLFVDGQQVLPVRLQESGYCFRFPTVKAAILDAR